MGSAPSVPASTTQTTTVNQSPWQNPTYTALMLGSSGSPGPVSNMLNAANYESNLWNQSLTNPGVLFNDPTMTPAQAQSLVQHQQFGAAAPTWAPTSAVPSVTSPSINNRYGVALDQASLEALPTVPSAAAAPAPSSTKQSKAEGGLMSIDPRKGRK